MTIITQMTTSLCVYPPEPTGAPAACVQVANTALNRLLFWRFPSVGHFLVLYAIGALFIGAFALSTAPTARRKLVTALLVTAGGMFYGEGLYSLASSIYPGSGWSLSGAANYLALLALVVVLIRRGKLPMRGVVVGALPIVVYLLAWFADGLPTSFAGARNLLFYVPYVQAIEIGYWGVVCSSLLVAMLITRAHSK